MTQILGVQPTEEPELKPYEVLGRQNVERLQRLASMRIQVNGIGEHWNESLWAALVGQDVLDRLHMEHEQWVSEMLDKHEQVIRDAQARAMLLAPGAVPPGPRAQGC